MQLKFNRTSYEKKGMFGSKTRYKLEAMVDVDETEKKFLSEWWNLQYLALGNPLKLRTSMDFASALAERRAMEFAMLGDYSTDQLLKGLSIEADDPATIQIAETGIVAACKHIQAHTKADATFASGSERVIEL